MHAKDVGGVPEVELWSFPEIHLAEELPAQALDHRPALAIRGGKIETLNC